MAEPTTIEHLRNLRAQGYDAIRAATAELASTARLLDAAVLATPDELLPLDLIERACHLTDRLAAAISKIARTQIEVCHAVVLHEATDA